MGRSLALLLKCNSLVREIALYDIANAHGLAVDLSHINTPTKVTGHSISDKGLTTALQDADVVVITGGMAQKVPRLFYGSHIKALDDS